MLKTFAVALVAVAMTAGLAQASMIYRHSARAHVIPGCSMGAPARATCACGTAGGHALICHRGQWCHPGWSCSS